MTSGAPLTFNTVPPTLSMASKPEEVHLQVAVLDVTSDKLMWWSMADVQVQIQIVLV